MKKGLKILDVLFTVIKVICIILLILLILVLAMQRFSNNQIAIGGFRVFNVVTESMIPDYQVGDIIVVKDVPATELKLGDDITYLGKVDSFKGRVVTHRLIKIDDTEEETAYETQGIANDIPDPTITADQIYGKVVYKCIVISALAKLMNNMTLFYIVVFIPLAILIVMQIIDFANGRKETDEDEDDYDDDKEDDEYEDEDDDEEDNE